MTLCQLCDSYKKTTSKGEKNKIISKIFKQYNGLITSYSFKLHKKFFTVFDVEDFQEIIKLGIWRGIIERKGTEPYNRSIFRCVRSEVSRALQPLYAKKNYSMYNNSSFNDDIYDMHTKIFSDFETDFAIKQDLDKAVSQLSSNCKDVIELVLYGFSLKEIQEDKNISVYYYFKQAKKELLHLLGVGYL